MRGGKKMYSAHTAHLDLPAISPRSAPLLVITLLEVSLAEALPLPGTDL